MSSEIIYLYVKQCTHCNLKYFGKSTNIENFHTYEGSGTYWIKHLKFHHGNNWRRGQENVSCWEFDNILEARECASWFSHVNKIVESKDWANLIPENSLDGFPAGTKQPVDSVKRRSITRTGMKRGPHSEETKVKISKALTGHAGHPMSEKAKKENSLRMKNNNPMKNSETREKVSRTLSGRKRTWETSEVTKQKMRDLHLLRIEYKGSYYLGWDEFTKQTKVTPNLYTKYYLNGIDPEPYIGVCNIHLIKKITPIILE